MNEKKILTFEQALSELEKIVQKLEQPDVPVEDAVQMFQDGVNLSRHCSEILEKAELRIEEVNKNQSESE